MTTLTEELRTMADIDRLRAVVLELEWSGTAHGAFGTAQRCPVCLGVKVGQSLNQGRGLYVAGKGHKDDCALALALQLDADSPPRG